MSRHHIITSTRQKNHFFVRVMKEDKHPRHMKATRELLHAIYYIIYNIGTCIFLVELGERGMISSCCSPRTAIAANL
jgi:hypothetical protein